MLVGVAMATAIFQWVYICFVAWYVKKKRWLSVCFQVRGLGGLKVLRLNWGAGYEDSFMDRSDA
jgi:Na+-driven multidrug efflux pump